MKFASVTPPTSTQPALQQNVAPYTVCTDPLSVCVSGQAYFGNDPRFKTHLSTDKAIYRPGESVRLRAVYLHALTLAPMSPRSNHGVQLAIKGPKVRQCEALQTTSQPTPSTTTTAQQHTH